jgi:hypothetical protein
VTDEPAAGRRRFGRTATVLAALGAIVTTAAAGIGLLFVLAPGLQPCLGSANATFGDAPVVPRVAFRDHLIRRGVPYADAARQPNSIGAEVRFTFRTEGYRGEELPVTWSPFYVGTDGVLGGVVRGQDRAVAMTVEPNRCRDGSGYDLFVPIPNRTRRYRIMLELFRDRSLQDRLDLVETKVFTG